MAWACLILIVSLQSHWSSVCLLNVWRQKKRSALECGEVTFPIFGCHQGLKWIVFFLWLNSLLSFTQPKPHFPSSWRNNQTCHGPNKGQSITFSFKQHCLDPVVFSVFIYCSWSWNTFQMWFARAPARSQPSRGALAGLWWPQGVLGWGAPLPAVGLGRGAVVADKSWLLLLRGASPSFCESEECGGVQTPLITPGLLPDECVEGRGWAKGARPQDNSRRGFCAIRKGQQTDKWCL